MNKQVKMQEAFELSKKGYSYGQIATEIGEPKSNVGRWIKAKTAENETSETDGTPVSTDMGPSETFFLQDGSELVEDISKVGQSTSKDMIIPKSQDNSSQVELRKAELEHEYRMEKLKFYQQQFLEKLKTQTSSQETKRLQEELLKIKEELETLQRLNLDNQQKVISKLPKQNILPKEYSTRLVSMLNDYLMLEGEYSSFEYIEAIENDIDELITEVENWANENEIDLSISAEMKMLKSFNKDVNQTLSWFEDEQSDDLKFNFDKKWQTKVYSWLETI